MTSRYNRPVPSFPLFLVSFLRAKEGERGGGEGLRASTLTSSFGIKHGHSFDYLHIIWAAMVQHGDKSNIR